MYVVFIFIIIVLILSISYFLTKNIEKYTQHKRPIYVFWTGKNKMSENRRRCLESIKSSCKVKVILITPDNLDKYILKDYPLHPGFEYLSLVHKSDYLRTYFMNFHGGGYTDIKQCDFDWNPYFKILEDTNNWCIGYSEIPGGSASTNEHIRNSYKELIGNGMYIFKKRTPLTEDWYRCLQTKMDEKYESLKQNPAVYPREFIGSTEYSENGSKYPLRWAEILGEIFHDVLYKYRENCLNDMPCINTNKYI